MKSTLVLGSLLLAVCGAQAAVLFDNGPVVGADGLSVMPSTDSTYGYSVYLNMGFVAADDFRVGDSAWTVSSLDLFGYQPMATTKFFFQSATWSIVAGDPNNGQVIASGVTPIVNGGIAGYRVDAADPTNRQRTIFDLKVDIPDVQLSAGTYWLTWGLTASESFDGPFTPPTADGRSGNAMETSYWSTFAPLTDTKSGNTYDLPFVLNGTVAAVPEPTTLATMAAGLFLLGVRRRHARAR